MLNCNRGDWCDASLLDGDFRPFILHIEHLTFAFFIFHNLEALHRLDDQTEGD